MATPTTEQLRSALQHEDMARQSQQKRDRVNLGTIERWLSGLAGGALLGYGVLRRDWISATIAAVGGALVARGAIDPSFVITHRLSLDEGPEGYDIFKHKEDNCIKVVLKP